MERDLLIRALAISRHKQAHDDPSLLLEAVTHNGEWARTEADHLTRILDRLHGADLRHKAVDSEPSHDR